MRSFAIAAVMTILVAGLGFVAAPVPRGAGSARVRSTEGLVELGAPSAERAPLREADGKPVAARNAAPGKRTFYQWTDERGSVRFARSLDEVPPAWRARAGQVEVDTSAYQPKLSAPAASRAAQRAPAEPAAAAAPDVTVYTAPWCGWCRKTLAFLDQRGVEYVNKDIEADEEYAAELEEKSGGRSIPFVEIDGTRIRGYNPREMAALLD